MARTNGTKARVLDQVRGALDNAGSHMGDLTWWACAGQVRRVDARAELRAEGLPEDLLEEEISFQAALGRAKGSWREGDSGHLLRLDEDTGELLVVQQVKKTWELAATIAIDSNGALVVTPGPAHNPRADAVASELTVAYQRFRDYADGAEVGRAIRRGVAMAGGICLKTVQRGGGTADGGHVYWVPAVNAQMLRSMASVVERLHVGAVDVVPVFETPDAVRSVSRAAVASFGEELRKIETELTRFGSKRPRVSTLEDRMAEYAALRERVEVYADILGAKRDGLFAQLDAATKAARDMIAAIDTEAQTDAA